MNADSRTFGSEAERFRMFESTRSAEFGSPVEMTEVESKAVHQLLHAGDGRCRKQAGALRS